MINTQVVEKPKKYRSMKAANRTGTILSYIALTILAILWMYPILWIVINAFRVEYIDDVYVGIVSRYYWPGFENLGLENFARLFENFMFGRWFLNTFIVAVFTFIISTFLILCVAYVMSKLKFKARKTFLSTAIILGLFPGFMSMVAIYYILKALQLTETLGALILVYSAGSGLGFYVAKGFFDVIPDSLIESGRLDGATNFQIFTKIIVPLSKPIIIYTALTSFIGPWMDFIFARVILGTTNPELFTVSVGLYDMMYGNQPDSNVFTVFCAGSVIVAIPIVTLFVAMQRYYVEGVTAGAVKG